jgi:hypothetical protein
MKYAFLTYGTGDSLIEILPASIGAVLAGVTGSFVFSALAGAISFTVRNRGKTVIAAMKFENVYEIAAFNSFLGESLRWIKDFKYFRLYDKRGTGYDSQKTEDKEIQISYGDLKIVLSFDNGRVLFSAKAVLIKFPSEISAQIRRARLVLTDAAQFYREIYDCEILGKNSKSIEIDCEQNEDVNKIPESIIRVGLVERIGVKTIAAVLCTVIAFAVGSSGAEYFTDSAAKSDYTAFYEEYIAEREIAQKAYSDAYSPEKDIAESIDKESLPKQRQLVKFIRDYRPKDPKMNETHKILIEAEQSWSLYQEKQRDLLRFYTVEMDDESRKHHKNMIEKLAEYDKKLIEAGIITKEESVNTLPSAQTSSGISIYGTPPID